LKRGHEGKFNAHLCREIGQSESKVLAKVNRAIMQYCVKPVPQEHLSPLPGREYP